MSQTGVKGKLSCSVRAQRVSARCTPAPDAHSPRVAILHTKWCKRAAGDELQCAGLFFAAIPCRVVDTRNPSGLAGPFLAGGQSRTFPVPTSACNLYLTAWPTGQAQPLVATLNAVTGDGDGQGLLRSPRTGSRRRREAPRYSVSHFCRRASRLSCGPPAGDNRLVGVVGVTRSLASLRASAGVALRSRVKRSRPAQCGQRGQEAPSA
jgi:hypothetical protein